MNKKKQALEIIKRLKEEYPDADFELYSGAQAVYSYLISVE